MAHSQTFINGVHVPSVTETMGVVGKPFLMAWYKREVQKHGWRGWVKCDATSRRGMRIGTHMHGFIEAGLGGPAYTPWLYEDRKIVEPNRRVQLAQTLAKLVLDWLKENKIEVVRMEQKLISREDRYGGTFDAVLRFGNVLIVADWKSSNSLDKWYAVQVAAYIKAWNENNPNEPIDTGVVVRADKKAKKPYLQIVQYNGTRRYYKLFKACREIYDFDRNLGEWEKP
jgi:hypothetical protein